MSDWIPAHRRLFKGPKRGLSRAVRFVLLELSNESRATEGTLDLPLRWETLDALHDLIGGNRDEIRQALDAFTAPDENGDPVLSIERTDTVHRVVLVKWREWAGPKTSTERSQDKRARDRESDGGGTGHIAPDRHHNTQRNAVNVAPATRAPLHPATDATPTGQDRTVENRTEQESRAAAPRRTDESALTERLSRAPFRQLGPSIVGKVLSRMMTKGLKLPWVLVAIDDCEAKAVEGIQAGELQRMLIGYVDNAKPQKNEPSRPHARDWHPPKDDEPAVPPPPEAVAALAALGIGRGKRMTADDTPRRAAGGEP